MRADALRGAEIEGQQTWEFLSTTKFPWPGKLKGAELVSPLRWSSAAWMQSRTVPEATATGRPQRPTLRPPGTCGTHETTGARRQSWLAR